MSTSVEDGWRESSRSQQAGSVVLLMSAAWCIGSWTFPADTARGRFAARSTLLRDLQAFYLEHEYCGELDGGVESERVWMMCSCGAKIVR